MSQKPRDSLKLKAAAEFGSGHTYTIKNGGLGRTLVVDVGTISAAHAVRKKIPTMWEGLYTLVVYSSDDTDEDYCDPNLV